MSYHHGELQAALVRAGIEILSEQGIEALTLRETARRAGVSHSAPYRHFQNKEELLKAVAAEGFSNLTRGLREAVAAGGGNFRRELSCCGRAYVDFALSRPEHLKLMFSARRFSLDLDCLPGREDLDAFSVIAGVFERALELGAITSSRPPQALALLVWAQVHGLSHIIIEQQIPPGTISLEAALSLIDEQVEHTCRGLAYREAENQSG